MLTREGFIIVNASSSQRAGSHWMILMIHENKIYLAIPLRIPIQNYQLLCSRSVQFYNELTQLLKIKSIQNQNSKLCGLFCQHISHVMFGYEHPLMLNMNDNDLLHFAKHKLQYFNSVFANFFLLETIKMRL